MEYTVGSIVFDKWVIKKSIGQGAYGEVFEIEKNNYGITAKAALKVMTIPKNRSEVKTLLSEGMDEASATTYFEGFVQDVLREIEMMSRLKDSENIVSIEDYSVIKHEGEIGWDILIRMELLTDLNTYNSEHPMTEKDVINLGIDICNALDYCKRNDVIHRDIKPDNIFVSKTGTFKLGDFGVARTLEKTVGASKKGTESYMAPEVYLAKPYDASVDIYSLGLVMYKLLNSNRMPFYPPAGKPIVFSDKENAIKKRMSGQLPEYPANASDEVAQIILNAIAYDPASRWDSPKAMITALNLYNSANGTLDENSASSAQTYEFKYHVDTKKDSKDNLITNQEEKTKNTSNNKKAGKQQKNKSKKPFIIAGIIGGTLLLIGGAFFGIRALLGLIIENKSAIDKSVKTEISGMDNPKVDDSNKDVLNESKTVDNDYTFVATGYYSDNEGNISELKDALLGKRYNLKIGDKAILCIPQFKGYAVSIEKTKQANAGDYGLDQNKLEYTINENSSSVDGVISFAVIYESIKNYYKIRIGCYGYETASDITGIERYVEGAWGERIKIDIPKINGYDFAPKTTKKNNAGTIEVTSEYIEYTIDDNSQFEYNDVIRLDLIYKKKAEKKKNYYTCNFCGQKHEGNTPSSHWRVCPYYLYELGGCGCCKNCGSCYCDDCTNMNCSQFDYDDDDYDDDDYYDDYYDDDYDDDDECQCIHDEDGCGCNGSDCICGD